MLEPKILGWHQSNPKSQQVQNNLSLYIHARVLSTTSKNTQSDGTLDTDKSSLVANNNRVDQFGVGCALTAEEAEEVTRVMELVNVIIAV